MFGIIFLRIVAYFFAFFPSVIVVICDTVQLVLIPVQETVTVGICRIRVHNTAIRNAPVHPVI